MSSTTSQTVILPRLLLDVVTGDLLPDRAVVVADECIVDVVATADAPSEGPLVVDLPATPCCQDWSTATPTSSASRTAGTATPSC